MHPILNKTFTLSETASLAGLSNPALYKAVARGSLSISARAGGVFAFDWNRLIATCAYAELQRSGIPASAADRVACLIVDGEIANHLAVRRKAEIWACVTRTPDGDVVELAWGYVPLKDALMAAGGNVTTLCRLHSLVAEILDAVEALRGEAAL